jgi:hypothetical protein
MNLVLLTPFAQVEIQINRLQAHQLASAGIQHTLAAHLETRAHQMLEQSSNILETDASHRHPESPSSHPPYPPETGFGFT